MVSDDDRSQVFLGNILTAPVENNGTDVSICPGVGLNCCGDTNFQRMCTEFMSPVPVLMMGVSEYK